MPSLKHHQEVNNWLRSSKFSCLALCWQSPAHSREAQLHEALILLDGREGIKLVSVVFPPIAGWEKISSSSCSLVNSDPTRSESVFYMVGFSLAQRLEKQLVQLYLLSLITSCRICVPKAKCKNIFDRAN